MSRPTERIRRESVQHFRLLEDLCKYADSLRRQSRSPQMEILYKVNSASHVVQQLFIIIRHRLHRGQSGLVVYTSLFIISNYLRSFQHLLSPITTLLLSSPPSTVQEIPYTEPSFPHPELLLIRCPTP